MSIGIEQRGDAIEQIKAVSKEIITGASLRGGIKRGDK